jgi:hypothetical protein
MQVTSDAMIKTYIGMRISLRIQRRVADTSTFDIVRTISVASPSPRPLTKVEVKAGGKAGAHRILITHLQFLNLPGW